MRNLLRSLFNDAIRKAFPDAPEEAAILACNQAKFGDYQCNNAMALHGRMKGQEGALKSPRAVAEALLAQLPDNPLISETRCARCFNLMLYCALSLKLCLHSCLTIPLSQRQGARAAALSLLLVCGLQRKQTQTVRYAVMCACALALKLCLRCCPTIPLSQRRGALAMLYFALSLKLC